jgi:hypothetical protein
MRPVWARQPQINVRPDYSGLGAGVQMLLLPMNSALLDVSAEVMWTPTGNARYGVATPNGMAASFDGNGDYFTYTGYPWIVGATGTFFMWAETIRGLDTSGSVWLGTNTGSNAYFHSQATIAYAFGVQCTQGAITTVAGAAKTSLVFSANTAVSTGQYFQNGVAPTTPKVGTTPTAFAAGDKAFQFGKWSGGTTWDANADIVVAGFTNRYWGEDEAKAFHENPWQVFAPLPRRTYFGVTAGGGSFQAAWARQRSAVIGAGVR